MLTMDKCLQGTFLKMDPGYLGTSWEFNKILQVKAISGHQVMECLGILEHCKTSRHTGATQLQFQTHLFNIATTNVYKQQQQQQQQSRTLKTPGALSASQQQAMQIL